MSQRPFVFFDLETTGLDTSVCDIVQLAAVCGDRVINFYMVPTQPFSKGASNITGFTVQNGTLYHREQLLTTVLLCEALSSFISFLRSFPCPVVLAAHNGKRFDVPVLSRALHQCNLWQDFQQVVHSFLDTLPLSKSLKPSLEKHSLESLVAYFFKTSHNAHNAVEDAKALEKLYNRWNPGDDQLLGCTFNMV